MTAEPGPLDASAAAAMDHGPDAPWWRCAVGYQVYVRSFQDSDGDGIGDLAGLRRRLGYLAELGIDLVWVTPFYPSPQADNGYDVSDYTAVDPQAGTMADLHALVADAHALGIRVVVDLVANHTSDRHPWFVDARSGRDAPHRDYYVWRDPAPDGGPPNNWVSHFGGPAWARDPRSGQYYLHLFLPEQPDLNWAEPRVAREFERILRFWLEQGVDGFRIDVAHALVKDPDLRDNPLRGAPPPPDAGPRATFAAYEHRHDLDQPGVLDVFRRWRRIVAAHDAVLLGEVYLLQPRLLTRYLADGDGLHAAFCFPALHTRWDADDIRTVLTEAVDAGAGGLAWPLSSHDDPRAATRFGGGPRGAKRALAYLTLLCALPGTPFLYQGDELGLDDGQLEPPAGADVARDRDVVGRDGSRTPMTWEPGPAFGFTTGRPWLPPGSNRRDADTVAVQRNDPGSHLSRVRELLRLRRGLTDLRGDAPLRWLTHDGPLVAACRGGLVVACNVDDEPSTLDLDVSATVLFSSAGTATVDARGLRVPADSAALARLDGDEG